MKPKGVSMSLLHFIPAAGGFLNFQVEPLLTAGDEHRVHTYIMRIILVVIWSLNMLSYVVLDLPVPHFKSLFVEHPNARVYIDTAVVVVISYVSLLVINVNFIVLAVFPFIALAFIGALGRGSAMRGRVNGGEPGTSSSTGVAHEEGKTTTEEAEQLKAISVVPYWVLCAMGHFRTESLAVSQFLLFLATTLGALMLMLKRLTAGGVAPGVVAASELLRKASLVVLLVTVHAMAAELLGEDVVLLFVPELVPALLWFSLNIDRGSQVITVDEIKSHRNGLVLLGAVAAAGFAYLAFSMDRSGVSRCMMMTSVSCGVSGLLVYSVVFMLHQWPARGTATGISSTVSYLEKAIKLLKFWANLLLFAAAALLVPTSVAAVRLVLHEHAVHALLKFLKEYYV
ncbi:uncharacterized protein LOC127759812 [Oryza glaberrima]|uniref:uncharacterized protein LOC127759812 n=1 Tax=Oryza glaberrima TaxID=4538 RepID=UPI00224C5C52|nr:uncharacterized protein LOC127759812 [Oryza glaberrima]